MKNKLLFKIFNYCIKLFKKKKIYFGHNTYNAYSETIHLIYSTLKLNLNKKLYNISINKYQFDKIKKLAIKRIKYKIPIAYLTNSTWFCNKKFYINKNVMIPRSPISEIINNKFKCINKKFMPKKILDLCTGSACIAISCSYIFPKSKIHAVDISHKALLIAKKNIKLHNKNKQIIIKQSNLFNNLKKNKYDLIITNPPYINKKHIKFLPKEYSYEPLISLITKDNGLFIIKQIINNSYKYLNKKGILICEVGYQKKHIEKKININLKWIKTINKKNNIFYIKKKYLKNIFFK